eukprot:14029614-Alexandrium_andersonii.AAC.1
MSASLVGSEMCIRDSAAGALQEAPPLPCHLWSIHARRARNTWPGSCRSVSYTHLTLPTICSV